MNGFVSEALHRVQELEHVPKLPEHVKALIEAGDSIASLATDTGNARIFARMYAGKVIYVHGLGWYVWDGQRWCEDKGNTRVTRMMQALSLTWAEVGKYFTTQADTGAAGIAYKQARAMLSLARIRAALELAKVEEAIHYAENPFDRAPMLLNVTNGVLDLQTGELLPHSPDLMCSRMCRVAYNPDAQAPRWTQFLREVFNGDESLVNFMRRFLGYSLTGDMSEQRYVIAWGSGANGKSTLYNAVRYVLGDYATTISAEALMLKRNASDNVNTDIAQLEGVRLVVVPEWDEALRANEVLLKSITGGDPVRVRRLYHDSIEIRPQCKIHIFGNHKPELRGRDDATWRRPLLVPFVQSFKDNPDAKLPETLRAEAEGILADLVRGCMEWQRGGLAVPDVITRAVDGYREEMDDVSEFITSECVKGGRCSATVGQLHEAYLRWGGAIRTARGFGQALRELGYQTARTRVGVVVHGLGLRAGSESSQRSEG